MNDPIVIKIDRRLYSQEAIISVLYEYSGHFNVDQAIDNSDENYIIVGLIPQVFPIGEETEIKQSFMRHLVDQQLRIQVNQEFGHIRDLIVEEAFKPITKV